MSITFGAFANGDLLVANDIETNLSFGDSYLQGGIVTGDITAATIPSSAIFRPDWYTYPVGGFYGVSSGGFHRWVDQTARFFQSDTREELLIKERAYDDSIVPILGWGVSIDLPDESLVKVEADGQAMGLCDAGTNANLMAMIGRLSLCYRNRSTRTVTEVQGSRRDIYAGGVIEALFSVKDLFMLETLAAGSYDIFVGWTKTASCSTSAKCVSFGSRTLLVRSFRGQ